MNYLFSTLNRYFCRTFLGWLSVSCVTILAVVSLFEATEYARRSIGRTHVHAAQIIEMVLLKLPQHLQLLCPFMILVATILTFWRFHHTAELTVARSNGLSIWQCLYGLVAAAVIFSAFELFVLNPVAAAMTTRLQNLEANAFSGQENRLSISETGLWLRETQASQQNIIHAYRANLRESTFFEVEFYHFNPEGHYLGNIHAKKALLTPGQWHLEDATIWREGDLRHEQTINIPTELTPKKIQEGNLSPESISFWQLGDYIRILEKSGLTTLEYRLYWHMQLAKGGLMIAMILLGIALSLSHPPRGTSLLAIGGALCLGLLVYFVRDVVYALGLSDKIPCLLAAWTPALVTILLSSALILHLEDG